MEVKEAKIPNVTEDLPLAKEVDVLKLWRSQGMKKHKSAIR